MPKPSFEIEHEYTEQGYQVLAGLDEAGKGAWAGPVVSAAVILPDEIDLPKLNDSKLLKESVREELYDLVCEQSIAYGVGIIDAEEIDRVGLAQAHRNSMNQAVAQLSIQPDLLLVDGKGISGLSCRHICIVKGDQKSNSIAAASILAKVTRDRLMKKYHRQLSQYQFHLHKGYGTKVHQEALEEHGPSIIHRVSYAPVAKFFQTSMI